jgi:predicted nuclease of predicted toxin-antitoxin system
MTEKRTRSKKPSATKAESLLNESVYFIDRCLGKQLGLDLQNLGFKIEFHGDHFQDDMDDSEWLLVVGKKGWVVFTKDKNIRKRPTELNAVILAKIRMFALSGGSMTGEQMSETFSNNMTKIGRFLKNNEPPFIARISASGVELVDLTTKPRKSDKTKKKD